MDPWGVTPFIILLKMAAASIQWAIGLELPLLMKNPGRFYLLLIIPTDDN